MKLEKSNSLLPVVFFMAACAFIAAVSPAYAAGASITGKVNFEGTPPVPKPINFGAERQCAMNHGDNPPQDESLVVNPNGTVKWTFIHVKEGAAGPFETPQEPLPVDQIGCIFTPHVYAAMAGQPVEFKNSDEVLHNVRVVSKTGQNMNLAQPIQGMKTKKVFKNPEIGMQVRCDVHFWMSSYLHVTDNPYHAITGEDGTFTLSDLPAGTYTLEAWHEKLGIQTQSVTVADGETKTVDFVFAKG